MAKPKPENMPTEADIAVAVRALRALGVPAQNLKPGPTVGRHKWPGRGYVSGTMGRCKTHIVSDARIARLGRELKRISTTLTPEEL